MEVDVGGAAVTLQVDDDDLVASGQRGKDRPDISPDRSRRAAGSSATLPVGLEAEVMPLTSTSWR